MKRETKESYARSLTSYNKLFYWYFLVLLSVALGTLLFISKTFAEETVVEVEVDTEKEVEKFEETTENNHFKGNDRSINQERIYIKTLEIDDDLELKDNLEEEDTTKFVENDLIDSSNNALELPSKVENVVINNSDLENNNVKLSNNKKNSENLSNTIEKNSEIVYNYNPVGNSDEQPKNDNKVVINTTPTENTLPTETNKDFVSILVNYDVEEAYITIDILETIEINSYESFVNLINTVCSSLNLKVYKNTDSSYYVLGNNGIYYLVRYSLASSVSTSSSGIKTEDILFEIFNISEEDIINYGLDASKSVLDLSANALLDFESYNNNNFSKTQTIEIIGKYNGDNKGYKLDNYTLNDFNKDEIIKIFSNLNEGLAENPNIRLNQNKIELGEDVKIEITIN